MGETIEALVDAGKASAGPPLGPSLGPTGVNVKDVVEAFLLSRSSEQAVKLQTTAVRLQPPLHHLMSQLETPYHRLKSVNSSKS